VILLFLTFIFGAGALYTATQLNALQDAQLRQFDKDLTGAKTELGNQQERAAHAEKVLLELQERVKDRRLSTKQHQQLLESLKPAAKGPTSVESILFDGDGREYAKDVNRVLRESGWANGDPG